LFISEAEAHRRLSSPKNLKNILSPRSESAQTDVSAKTPPGPDQPISGEVADPVLFAEDAQTKQEIIEKQKIIALSLIKQGVSKSEVCKQLNIEYSVLCSFTEQIGQAVAKGTERIRELAIDRMMIALGLMTQDKFENASLNDLNRSVKALSQVISSTDPNVVHATQQNVSFVIHTPERKALDSYTNIVDV